MMGLAYKERISLLIEFYVLLTVKLFKLKEKFDIVGYTLIPFIGKRQMIRLLCCLNDNY